MRERITAAANTAAAGSSAARSDLLTITTDSEAEISEAALAAAPAAATDPATGTAAEADENPPGESDPESAADDAPLRRAVASLAAAWLFAYAAHAAKLDPVTLVAIILGTTALNRYGSTVLDRVMAALVMLAGSAIVGGLVISFWPWGLDPVAVGGFAFSTLIVLSFATRRPFRLPMHFAAADGIAILSGAAATTIAAWPTTHGDFWKRFDYSALLADRLRQFAMFDVVRNGQSYAFAHFSRVSWQALPGARTYPSGMQMVYAIVDCFVHGNAKPGAPLDEFVRYYWYTLISFGLLVLAAAWAARRMVGPMATDRCGFPRCSCRPAWGRSWPPGTS